MTDWATRIAADDSIGLRWSLRIQGVPYVFLAGAIPTGPAGSAWAAPTAQTKSYTYLPHTLDVSAGVRDSGPYVDRRTGEVGTSTQRFTLRDDVSGTLLELFAQELVHRQHRHSTGRR
jgi:hypothetical protein